MTDSFGFNGEERYANRIEPVKEELASAVNDPEEMMMIIMEALNDTVTPIPEVGNTILLYTMQKLLILHMTNIH